jgi:hypothetical protein
MATVRYLSHRTPGREAKLPEKQLILLLVPVFSVHFFFSKQKSVLEKYKFLDNGAVYFVYRCSHIMADRSRKHFIGRDISENAKIT